MCGVGFVVGTAVKVCKEKAKGGAKLGLALLGIANSLRVQQLSRSGRCVGDDFA